MRRFIILATIFSAILTTSIQAQTSSELSATIKKNKTFKKEYNKAENFLAINNYNEALKIYLKLDSLYPNNCNINYKIGFCYSGQNRAFRATRYYEKSLSGVSSKYTDRYYEVTAPLSAYVELAGCYLEGYKFDKAIQNYDIYLEKEKLTSKEADSIRHLKQKAIDAPKVVRNPLSIRIENLNSTVNSQYDEYSPVITIDGQKLYFTSRRSGSTGGALTKDGRFYEDVYCSVRNSDGEWSEAKQIEGDINTKGHEATISISQDGNTIFLYKDDKGDGNIYMSEFINGTWGTPEKLPEPINTKSWETHACMSPDNNTIYFVSNRKGGEGGRDIWKSEKKDGKWGKAQNLGTTINTRYDEESPYMLPDGKTLYFSSQGHTNMGGFDIFITTLNDDGTWSEPENIGYPINTTGDDIFYMPTPDQKEAFYSSSKRNGFGGQDLYALRIIHEKKKFIYVQGLVADAQTLEPLNANISITSKKDSSFLNSEQSNSEGIFVSELYFDDEFTFIASADGYDNNQESLAIGKKEKNDTLTIQILLNKLLVAEDTTKPEINIGDKIILKNIFYDFDKATLRAESKVELDKLVKLMNDIPTLKIELGSHTDSYGSDQYNILLSKRRADSVINYLIKSGIDTNRLVSNGYGETKPIASNTTDEGRQLNRRTEFTVISK